ncbi:MAG TPA: hypothetical protein VN915_08540 [Elusimicrobiota bacterium]|nr:hypothetical protein [Elusimicrobiota bacterium]
MKRRSSRTARQAVRAAVVWAPLLAAALGGAPPARASNRSQLNINVLLPGISNVSDLTAAPGVSTGTISLSWTEPFHTVGVAPYSYDVRVSTVGQISDDVVFSTSPPLSVFSTSVPPSPGAGGGAAGFIVTGLTPDVTYFFAIRENDSTTFRDSWNRSASPPLNVNNFAVATSTRPPSPAGGGAASVSISSLTATWAISSGATDYMFVVSTSAVNPPTAIAASSSTVASTATVSGLGPNTTYFLFVSACAGGCSAYASLGSTITLAEPAVGLSTTSVSSSTVNLAWNPNGDPPGTLFQVLKSTDGVSYSTAASATSPAAAVAGLSGGGTYYFEVVAVNGAGVPASPSNVVQLVTPAGPVPSAPTGLAASAGLLSASLTWAALPPALQGQGLLEYRVLRSTNAGFGYVQIATTTGVSFVDKPLAAGVTVYYELIARDIGNTDSSPSASVSAVPFTLDPMEPLGIAVVPSSAAVTLSWSPTTRFYDGTAFVSTGTPTGDELVGYSIYRSTDVCDPTSAFVQLSTMPIAVNSLTTATGGLNYYYRVFSFNSLGRSPNAVTVSALGERDYCADDQITRVVIDDKTAASLNAASNGLGGDIRIVSQRRPQDVGNGVFQSASFLAYLNGVTALSNYALPAPARIVLRFDTNNGSVVATTAPVNGFGPLAANAAGSQASPSDLGVFWFNGQQYQKMYGKIDPVGQTVSVDSPNLGIYQIRSQARAAGAVFDVSNLASRVITPNGDGLNDTLIFAYDPGPRNVVPEGKIFDLRGAFVADMVPGLVPNTLTWNGYMNGMPVHSGVYVYRITGDGKTFTGTIVVAR